MSARDAFVSLAVMPLWMGAWAQLLGMPLAWLRLRKMSAWKNRPVGLRRIDLLARFILTPTALTILWGAVAWAVAVLGGLGLSGGVLLIGTLGVPAIFVPWAVLRLDKDSFPAMVEEVSRAREEKLAARQ